MRLIIVSLLAFTLCGCSVGTSKPNRRIASSVLSDLTYGQDPKTEQCFAMVSTSHAMQVSDDGLSITWVPCDPKVLAQINK